MLDKISQSGSRESGASSFTMQEPPNITIAQVLRFLNDYRWTIVISAAIPVILALLYCLLKEPIYTAQTQLLIDQQTPIQDKSGDAGATYDSSLVESQIAVLRSGKIALTVVKSHKLLEDPEFGGDPSPPVDEAAAYLRSQRVISTFARNLDVRRNGISYAINIAFSSRDPNKAAAIANAVAEAFVQDQLTARANAVRAGSEWLEQRIDQLRGLMNASALKVQEFKVKRDYRIIDRPASVGADKSAPNEIQPDTLTLDELESTAQTYRRIYESYLQAYTESVQRQSFPVSNARVITLATRPLTKSHPQTTLIVTLAGLVGTLAGLLLAISRHSFISALKS